MDSNQRREFLKKSSLAAVGAFTYPVWSKSLKRIPLIEGKHPEMTLLNDRPLNMEAPPHLLNDAITPADKFFVRNNGIPPSNIDVDNWTLKIGGESVKEEKAFSIKQLKEEFDHHTYQLTIECGGNGRAEFNPPAKGNQWTTGAVACANWTGVRLKDILMKVGLKPDAVYIGYYGADKHLSNDPGKVVISRGVPLSKAMEEETLIAWAMNGKDIPLQNGYPLRLVIGGWPGSVSGKWLKEIVVRNQVHDGPKMGGYSYRVPCESVAPGEVVPEDEMCIIQSMPVKSLITYPKTGALVKPGQQISLQGHAWAGDGYVASVEYSIDFGASWIKCKLDPPANRLAWQNWSAMIQLPKKGYYEVWAKATDEQGRSQPMVVPGWNPKGYLNNACHRIAVKVR